MCTPWSMSAFMWLNIKITKENRLRALNTQRVINSMYSFVYFNLILLAYSHSFMILSLSDLTFPINITASTFCTCISGLLIPFIQDSNVTIELQYMFISYTFQQPKHAGISAIYCNWTCWPLPSTVTCMPALFLQLKILSTTPSYLYSFCFSNQREIK